MANVEEAERPIADMLRVAPPEGVPPVSQLRAMLAVNKNERAEIFSRAIAALTRRGG